MHYIYSIKNKTSVLGRIQVLLKSRIDYKLRIKWPYISVESLETWKMHFESLPNQLFLYTLKLGIYIYEFSANNIIFIALLLNRNKETLLTITLALFNTK